MHLFPELTAKDSLSLQYDGPIPPHLLRAAEAIDKVRKPKRPARVRIVNVEMLPNTAIDLMATTMVDAFMRRGEVTRDDLKRVGFTDGDIDTYSGRAFRRACTDEPRITRLAGDAH